MMDKEKFCDKYCPIPDRWIEFPKIDNKLTVDCDLDESDCPFKDVDFSKVEVSILPQAEPKWCPQHGYPEPCAKCKGLTQEEMDKFYKSLAKSLDIEPSPDLVGQVAEMEYERNYKPQNDLLSGFAGEIAWDKAPKEDKQACIKYAKSLISLIRPSIEQEARKQERERLDSELKLYVSLDVQESITYIKIPLKEWNCLVSGEGK
jgi:hypothetical protein